MSEGASDSDDLFNPRDVRVATVDCVTHSRDGGEDGLVCCSIFREGDCCLCSSERRANGGTSTWNCLYRGCDVFLVRVIELTGGGLVGVREVFVSDADESDRRDLYEY